MILLGLCCLGFFLKQMTGTRSQELQLLYFQKQKLRHGKGIEGVVYSVHFSLFTQCQFRTVGCICLHFVVESAAIPQN